MLLPQADVVVPDGTEGQKAHSPLDVELEVPRRDQAEEEGILVEIEKRPVASLCPIPPLGVVIVGPRGKLVAEWVNLKMSKIILKFEILQWWLW